jgi:uncharacterized caspase-like protein
MRRLVLLVCILISLLVPAPAQAQQRVALVVGNSAYQYTSELDNPKNDAADIAAALKKHGFQVIEGVDLNKAAFDRKVGDFAVALRGADAGVFFYAGHGLQVGGVNYLVPIDAQAEDEARLDLEMVRVDLVHRIMERQTGSNVLFLDACRDNPLARNLATKLGTRSVEVGRGLRQVEAGAGTLISFATQPGNVALDGAGRNSPYTGALVKHLVAAKGDLNAILVNVRKDVMQATRNRQVPWENSALTDHFYFGASAALTKAAPPVASPAETAIVPSTEAMAAIRTYIVSEYLQDRGEFADPVEYYDKGVVTRAFALADHAKYAARWPTRSYQLIENSIAILSQHSDRITVSFRFRYVVSNPKKTVTGVGAVQLTLRTMGTRYLVEAVKETVTRN